MLDLFETRVETVRPRASIERSNPMPLMRCFVCCLPLFFTTSLLANERSPNIVLILTDDQGWSQVSKPMDPRIAESCSSYLETPNIDRLACEGLRFTNGYAPAPPCTPTRRSILCGTSAARSGTEFKSKWVPSEHMTIPKALKQASSRYRCTHFGKWGENMIPTPQECAYDAGDGMTGNVTGGMPKSLGVASGKMRGSQLYRVEPNPREKNFEIGAEEPAKAKELRERLLDYLSTVNAETTEGSAANSKRRRVSPRQE